MYALDCFKFQTCKIPCNLLGLKNNVLFSHNFPLVIHTIFLWCRKKKILFFYVLLTLNAFEKDGLNPPCGIIKVFSFFQRFCNLLKEKNSLQPLENNNFKCNETTAN